MTRPEVRRPQITDKRTVTVTVVDAPEHRTPGGLTPIEPFALEITMWVWLGDTELRTVLEILGRRIGGSRAGETLTRRFRGESMAHAPEWARELAEKHRPSWAPERTAG